MMEHLELEKQKDGLIKNMNYSLNQNNSYFWNNESKYFEDCKSSDLEKVTEKFNSLTDIGTPI